MSSLFPWLDLPTPITELILVHLSPSDYIRFGSVCKEWHSIQKQHRIRHSPFPPPMKSIPWLVPCLPKETKKLFRCYSPFEQKCYPFSIPKSRPQNYIFASSHGWFFFLDDTHGYEHIPTHTSLFNPVSKSLIKLPPLISTILTHRISGALSTSPLSPDCVALILEYYEGIVYLCWLGQKQPGWVCLDVPFSHITSADIVYCNGRFYFFADKHFFVIDSIFTTPTIKALVMDRSKFSSRGHDQNLVEFNGEVLLVVVMYGPSVYERFEVVKADFSRMMWVKEKSIRDLAFFVGAKGSLCMLAADVGCKCNCVYVTGDVKGCFVRAWSVFDMNPRRRGRRWWSSGPLLSYEDDHFDHWFLPSLDYNV